MRAMVFEGALATRRWMSRHCPKPARTRFGRGCAPTASAAPQRSLDPRRDSDEFLALAIQVSVPTTTVSVPVTDAHEDVHRFRNKMTQRTATLVH